MSSSKRFGAALVGGMVLAGGVLWGCTGILGSFDVAGGSPSVDGADATSGADGTSPSDGSMPRDGNVADVDAAPPLVCKTGETKCPVQGVCALLATSGDNCGTCGHTCGGGICSGGVCQSVKIYDGTPQVGPIAVGHGVDFFFATTDGNQDNRLYSCPASTGCKLAPKQLVVRQYSIDAINSVNGSTLTFISAPTQSTERQMIYACSPLGCPGTPVSFTGDGLNGIESRLASNGNNNVFYDLGGSGPGVATCLNGACTTPTPLGNGMTKGTHGFAVDATSVYFVDSAARGSTIAKCLQTDTACVPTTVVAGDMSAVQTVAVNNGKLYWIVPGRDSFVEGKLFTCDLPACSTSTLLSGGLDTTPTISNTVPPEELFVDDSGAYWLTRTNMLQRCTLNGCLGGPHNVAGPLLTPHSITADASFVYWAETTAVWRIAK